MDDWEKLNETSLPRKQDFYSPLIWKILLMQVIRMQKNL